MLHNKLSNLKRLLLITDFTFYFLIFAETLSAAQRLDKYFAHSTVEDQYGVIAPWYKGLNGQCDFRVRVAAETMKRYPWTELNEDGVALPEYMVNGIWRINSKGKIKSVPFINPIWGKNGYKLWMNGDHGAKVYYTLMSMINYYQYSGDPAAIAHIKMAADHMLDYTLTPPDHPWPKFPISVPIKGKGYTYYDPTSFIQLSTSAMEGLALLKAYQVVGESSWFEAAKHWGDLFAAKMNKTPGKSPWQRYATPESSPKWSNKSTGGIVLIQEFLDELIRLGYKGSNDEIIEARNTGREYMRVVLLPDWTVNDTFGRYFWDGPAAMQTVAPTDSVAMYLISNPDYFTNWRADTRNILSLYLSRVGIKPYTNPDVYNGAWAYSESFGCCDRSFDYSPMLLARVYARYGALANNEWAREMARRQIILTTYHFRETGVVEDVIDGGVRVAGNWFKIAHPFPLKLLLETMAWMPELFGANRENHIMRSSSVVNSVIYCKGNIIYSTFDAIDNTVDVLRLSFIPDTIWADGKKLRKLHSLNENGYNIQKLCNGDCIVTIRHDGKKNIEVRGFDPQKVIDDSELVFTGDWAVKENSGSLGDKLHVASKAGAVMTCSFKGNQVRLVGSVGKNGGLADIFIDNEKQLVHLDCWNPYKFDRQILYYRSGLSNGKHGIKIVTRGEKNFLSLGTNIYIDAVQYSSATGDSGFGEGGGPTETQRMIFGYPKRIPYKDSLSNEWLPGLEYRAKWTDTSVIDSVSATWYAKPAKNPITNTNDPELYRYGLHASEFWVNLTVGPGRYYAKLKFAATERQKTTGPMTILVNGKEVISNLNVKEATGGLYRALDKVVDNIKPQNGIIEVRLKYTGEKENGEAFIQALEVGMMDNL